MLNELNIRYAKIVNPITNRKVNITSSIGKKILKSYLFALSGGKPPKILSKNKRTVSHIHPVIKEFMDNEDMLEDEAIQLFVRQLKLSCQHFHNYENDEPDKEAIKFYNQNDEKFIKQLNLYNWDIGSLAEIYYDNPWYPDDKPFKHKDTKFLPN